MIDEDLVIAAAGRGCAVVAHAGRAVRPGERRPAALRSLTGGKEHRRGGRSDLTVLVHGRIDEALLGVTAGGHALGLGQGDLLQGDA
ncbi:hypothetical protein [Corynebacterium variabile]|uniref:hypothetical protein n=1 Tax=Corynebacterium variabile TaxID=1727 RepID=UPI0028AB2FC2|nr:hypothetical protein [Corynebacterium variabile]